MKDMKTGKEKEYKMNKDNVLLYDGGFIDYEQWNAPIVIDILEISIQNPVSVTILGGYAVGTANVQRDGTVAHPISLLFCRCRYHQNGRVRPEYGGQSKICLRHRSGTCRVCQARRIIRCQRPYIDGRQKWGMADYKSKTKSSHRHPEQQTGLATRT